MYLLHSEITTTDEFRLRMAKDENYSSWTIQTNELTSQPANQRTDHNKNYIEHIYVYT